MPPVEFFQLVTPVAEKYEASIFFRRYQPDFPKKSKFPPVFRNVELDDPLAEIFNDGRFSETYFSLGAVPKHDDDWKFWRSHTEQILVCDGGNIDASELQLSYLRIVAKQSDATRLIQCTETQAYTTNDPRWAFNRRR